MAQGLIAPHGGRLCNLIASEDEIPALKAAAVDLPSITLTPRQLCDVELLLNGGFSPLVGFLNKEDYERYSLTCNGAPTYSAQRCRQHALNKRTSLAHAYYTGSQG